MAKPRRIPPNYLRGLVAAGFVVALFGLAIGEPGWLAAVGLAIFMCGVVAWIFTVGASQDPKSDTDWSKKGNWHWKNPPADEDL